MIYRLSALLLIVAALTACAPKVPAPRWTPTEDHAVNVTLSEAATSVSHNLTTLAANEQAANPPKTVNVPPNPASYDMNIKASVNWQGGIEPLLKSLVAKTDYHLHILGNRPSIPVIINIDVKNEMIGNIIRDAALQAGDQAQVVILPSRKIVELRYGEKA